MTYTVNSQLYRSYSVTVYVPIYMMVLGLWSDPQHSLPSGFYSYLPNKREEVEHNKNHDTKETFLKYFLNLGNFN